MNDRSTNNGSLASGYFWTFGSTAIPLLSAFVVSLIIARTMGPRVVGLINLTMMPMFVGSGVFFSASNFPDALQPFLRLLPLTALNDALRAVMNEGAGWAAVWPQAANLALVSLLTFVVALKIFRWN